MELVEKDACWAGWLLDPPVVVVVLVERGKVVEVVLMQPGLVVSSWRELWVGEGDATFVKVATSAAAWKILRIL